MAKPFRVLLVNAVDTASWFESRQPNLGLGYLISSARAFLPQVEFEFRVVSRDPAEAVTDFRPDLVGLTCVSQNYPVAAAYAAELAARELPVIWGGVHISALPELLPPSAIGVLGEGELTWVELLKAALEGPLTPARLAAIPGLAYWDQGQLLRTAAREPLAELDLLPPPDRAALPAGPHAYLITSRGCPYRCAFCFTTRYWNRLRFHSAEYVADEIARLLRAAPVRLLSFYDDLFIANLPRLERLAQLLERGKLLGRIPLSCNCRANLVTPELVALLRRLGVRYATLGLESGDDETLHYLKGDNVTVEQNRRAVSLLRQGGMKVNAFFIIGSPRESREQMRRTYDFIRECRPDLVEVMLLTPFPGTPVWEYAKARGLVSERDFDWRRLDINAYRAPERAVILSELMERGEILAAYRRFRKLQMRVNLRGIWSHPMRGEMLGMTGAIVRDYLQRWFG